MHSLHPKHSPVAKKAKKTVIDRAMDVVAVISPMLGVPQAVQIFVEHNATGLSLFSWASFAAVAFVFLLYAIQHNIKPLIISEASWLVLYAVIIPGILIYG